MGTSARLAEPHATDRVEPGLLAEEQAALRRVATLVAAGAPPAEVFDAVTAEVAALIPADGSALTRYEADGTFTPLSGWAIEGGHKYIGRRYAREGTVSGLIFETGRPGRVDSYAEAPGEAPEAARELAWHSSVGAPITVGSRLWGALVVVSKSERPLPRETERRLAEFTELVATAIANSEAHQKLARLVDEQAALRRVATLVAQGVQPGEVFEAVSAEVAQLVGTDAAGVTRYEADGTFTALGGWARKGGYPVTGRRFPLEGSVSGLVLETRRPSRIDDFEGRSGEAAAAMRDVGWRSAMGAPISVEGSLWGVLVVYSERTEPLPPDTERRLGEFTEIVATALANAEGREEINRLADEQAALRRVATLVAEGGSPAAVFEAISGEVGRLVPADIAGLGRFAPDGTVTALGSWTRTGGPSGLDVGTAFPPEPGTAAARVFATRQPARVDSYDHIPGRLGDYARENGWRSSVVAPILVEGALWGLVIVASTTDTPLPHDTEARLTEFTELLATAIANAESRTELTRLAEEQAALRRVATLVAAGASPVQVFEAVSAEVAALIPADGSALTRYEADGKVTAVSGWEPEGGYKYVGRRYRLEGTVSGLISETGRPGRIENYDEAPGEAPEAAREMGWRSSVGAPITVEGRPWGVLAVVSKSEQPLPPEAERRLAEFTELVATAIANSDAHQELMELADKQAALRRVATLVAEGAPPAEVFDAVSAEVGRLVPADAAALARYETDGTATLLGGWTRTGAFLLEVGDRFLVDEGTGARAVFDTRRPARIDGYAQAPGTVVDRARTAGWRSSVAAPIIVEGGLWGFVTVASTTDRPLPPDTEERLAEFTDLVATAIANAESRAELDASRARIVATADATRRRIERDLHDGAQQQLVSLALELRAAQASVPKEMSQHQDELSHIAEGLTTALDGLREIALGLHPAILAEGGLAPALKTLAHRSPIPVELEVRTVGRLPESIEVAAYYVVSETLTNAAKHSRASQVQVEVEVRDRALCIAVGDDGVGGADASRGSGLLGLKDRAEAIGGTISLESHQGAGTNLIAELPLDLSTR
jgi:GAF domain-containing protein